MTDLSLTHREALALGAVPAGATFTVSQVSVWTQMSPTDAHDVIASLIRKNLVTRLDGDSLKLTDTGISAIRQWTLSGYKRSSILFEGSSFTSGNLDEDLDHWIENLE